jgi:tetratricopeptide (TPR) repeat protein
MKKAVTLIVIIFMGILLTSCQSKWKVDTDLTPEERQKIESEIKVIKEMIENQTDENGTGESMAYVNLARGYEKLGDLKKAVNVYKDAIASGLYTSSIYNNLGKLYEKLEEYDLAIAQYQILVNSFMENRYLYDITWAYIKAKDRKNAEKYFNAWQLFSQTTDKATQDAIKQLREEEKAA